MKATIAILVVASCGLAAAFAAIMILSAMLYFRKNFNYDIELSNYQVIDQARKQLDDASRPSMIGIVVLYEKNEDNETESHCSNNCVICLEEFNDGDSCKVLPNCKHLYHRLCIDRWLVKDTHCPLCRGSVYRLEPILPVDED